MTEPEILKQYDTMGEAYVRNQRQFFSGKEDWTRIELKKKLLEHAKGRILDIGCGAGDDVKWCAENGIEAVGIDPSATMCALARENVSNQDSIQVGGFEEIPFPDGHFDLIMSRFAMHYLRGLDTAYPEMARVLKSGGEIMLVVSHPTFDAMKTAETKQQLVTVSLYDNQVSLTFPPHSFRQYFSPAFLSLFDLEDIQESASLDADNPLRIPETLLFTAKKK